MTARATASTKQSARVEATRARLEEAAVAAFSAKGFHATTTRDIAAAAGMSPAALYVHHKTKEELLFLIASDGHAATLDLIRRARASSTEPAQQLENFMREFAEHHARNHASARVVNYELAALTPSHLAEVMEMRRAINTEVRAIVDDGIASGAFRIPNAALATTAILSLGIDIARWYGDNDNWKPAKIGSDYAALVLRMVEN